MPGGLQANLEEGVTISRQEISVKTLYKFRSLAPVQNTYTWLNCNFLNWRHRNFIYASQADELTRRSREDSDGNFRPRDEVEEDGSRVQALPIVIVRNANGEVLRLRDDLAKDVENKKLEEPWSVELIRAYLAKDTFDANPRLL